jgi:hypothetical protein
MKPLLLFTLLAFMSGGCTKSAPPSDDSENAYKVEKDQIVVNPKSAFLKHLEVVKTTKTPRGEVAFKTVGQIIALANTSGVLSSSDLSWVELDPDLTRISGLHLKSFANATAGTALGLTSVPAEYAGQIHQGETVDIARYGLKKTDVQASVVNIQPHKDDQGSSYVTFEIPRGQDWYPGTNCEVRFPLLHVQSVGVPTTAILHEGLSEFVMKQTEPGHYKVTPVFIVDETPNSAQVIGLDIGDSIVGSGAILLKPELHNFIRESKETRHGLK